MAEWLAARLAAQEEQIRLLMKEVSSLHDGLSNGLDAACITAVTPELESLQAENEKLKYRLLHLRRGLQAELELEKEKEEAPRNKRQGAKEATAHERNKHQQTNGVGVETGKHNRRFWSFMPEDRSQALRYGQPKQPSPKIAALFSVTTLILRQLMIWH